MLLDQSVMSRKLNFCLKAYTNPNTNPKTLTASILTLNDRQGDESFCAPVFCDYKELLSFGLRNFRTPRYFDIFIGRDYSTVDGRCKRKCYWTRASCDCGRLQIGDVTRQVEFLSNNYTNPNFKSRTFTTLALTLADHHDAFESFVRRYFVTLYGTIPA